MKTSMAHGDLDGISRSERLADFRLRELDLSDNHLGPKAVAKAQSWGTIPIWGCNIRVPKKGWKYGGLIWFTTIVYMKVSTNDGGVHKWRVPPKSI